MSLPQREGRPALDLSPDSTPDTASWDEDYGDVGMNPLNEPVPVRKGKEPPNGWMTVASDITSTSDKGSGTKGSEKR